MKFLFVTGGVVSSLGKGIFSSSTAAVLQSMGLKVNLVKMDPYLNVDAGTMAPGEHGEVFVTEDGGETDLDIGNYERFLGIKLAKENNITSGKIWMEVLTTERNGGYLGKTVQVFPHIIENIIQRLEKLASGFDVTVVEVGGTVGDVESDSFLHAINIMKQRMGQQACINVHLVLIPYLNITKELKTKPCQNSVQQLRKTGLQPDIIVGRSQIPLPSAIKKKIAYFTNLNEDYVLSNQDVSSIYELPLVLVEQNLPHLLANLFKFGDTIQKPDLSKWSDYNIKRELTEKSEVSIKLGLVIKYIDNLDSYISVIETIKHASVNQEIKTEIVIFDAQKLEQEDYDISQLEAVDCIIVPGGFGERGSKGKMRAIQVARTQKIPFLGICLGMQLATVEFARNVCNLDVDHEEFNIEGEKSKHIIHLMTEFIDREGKIQIRDHNSAKGGTLRLGTYLCTIKEGTKLREVMEADTIMERHRHRFEFNGDFLEKIEEKGMISSGKFLGKDINLVEVIEIKDHPFFIGVQYHPELQSSPFNPQKLFMGLIKAGFQRKSSQSQ